MSQNRLLQSGGYKGNRPQSTRLTASLFVNAHEIISCLEGKCYPCLSPRRAKHAFLCSDTAVIHLLVKGVTKEDSKMKSMPCSF
eukprot:1154541-Pelagomonas_calceolata.AAC.3